MDGGYLDQMSFACDIGASQWLEDADGNITWELLECAGLYDVTICAQGAFPQTDSQLAANLKDASATFASAKEAGLVKKAEHDLVAAVERGEPQDDPSQLEGAGQIEAVAERGGRGLAELQEWAEARFTQHSPPE
jgi:hypothetical protein